MITHVHSPPPRIASIISHQQQQRDLVDLFSPVTEKRLKSLSTTTTIFAEGSSTSANLLKRGSAGCWSSSSAAASLLKRGSDSFLLSSKSSSAFTKFVRPDSSTTAAAKAAAAFENSNRVSNNSTTNHINSNNNSNCNHTDLLFDLEIEGAPPSKSTDHNVLQKHPKIVVVTANGSCMDVYGDEDEGGDYNLHNRHHLQGEEEELELEEEEGNFIDENNENQPPPPPPPSSLSSEPHLQQHMAHRHYYRSHLHAAAVGRELANIVQKESTSTTTNTNNNNTDTHQARNALGELDLSEFQEYQGLFGSFFSVIDDDKHHLTPFHTKDRRLVKSTTLSASYSATNHNNNNHNTTSSSSSSNMQDSPLSERSFRQIKRRKTDFEYLMLTGSPILSSKGMGSSTNNQYQHHFATSSASRNAILGVGSLPRNVPRAMARRLNFPSSSSTINHPIPRAPAPTPSSSFAE